LIWPAQSAFMSAPFDLAGAIGLHVGLV
jgi:hypothetical protein